MEGVVHDGWLVKSPPEKRLVKPKWRQRWFVLRHSGLLPGQFILEYFTDNTCKKLKGKIDLDQCEQIDAGLPVDSKVAGYHHMFDIRTPKRTYYLLAETEAEMNKWVECICSVCGLKIHAEEDFLMPQDPSLNPTTNNSTVITASNLTSVVSSSNPYIPISECYTGKPVLNGNFSSLEGFSQLNTSQSTNSSSDVCTDVPKDPPPPPPKTEWQSNPISDEFYDHPKPLNIPVTDSIPTPSDTEPDDFYKVPAHLNSDVAESTSNLDIFHTLPPRVNWKTYPDDAFLPSSSSTVPRRKLSASAEINVYDVVPSYHGSIKEVKPEKKKVQSLASHFESMTVKTSPEPKQQNRFQESAAEYINQTSIVPPRPPKPSKMRDRHHRYENFELPHQIHKDDYNFEVPAPTKNAPNKNENEDEVQSVAGENACKEITMDDVYDFPQPQHAAKIRGEDNINAAVPPPQNTGTSQKNRRHAYTNAPPGLFNSKDLIFNYEYRPSLMTSECIYSAEGAKSIQSVIDSAVTPPSPSAIGAYANIPTSPTLASTVQNEMPPAVNRELKPKRGANTDDRGAISFLTLQPPPVCRSRTKDDKRSFRKPRAAPSPTPLSPANGMPPVPNRFRHHPDMAATSDEEALNSSGSRRNSSTDEQVKHFFPLPSKKDEIQYLDLDLDSEPSPSPKTPDRLSASTVYKKVDFVKTKAFNEMRVNVEETYRKSQ